MKPQPTDITIREVETSYEHNAYRTPIKFGGVAVTHAAILNVRVRVRTRTGREAEGSGSMPLSSIWAFPSKTIPEPQRLEAMKTLAEKIAGLLRGPRVWRLAQAQARALAACSQTDPIPQEPS